MSWFTKAIILFAVLCATESYAPHRYHFINENKNWTEAQKYCRDHFTDLAIINTMEDMNNLKTILNDKTGVWIGLQRAGTEEWRWSLINNTFYRGGGMYRNFDTGQPNQYWGGYACVNMYTVDGSWNDNNCKILLPFVCYDERNSDSNRYILIKENKTWYDAQTFCRDHYTDLVTVRNQTENQQIQNVSKGYTWVWIGLFYNSWTWSDQSSSSFRYWNTGEPNNAGGNENCTALWPDLLWYDVTCTQSHPFICQENRLVLIQQNLTWIEALNYCRNKHLDLVSVRREEIQQWVKEVAHNSTTEHVWLGLSYDCGSGIWFCLSGSVLCYQDWAPGNGTGVEDCSHGGRSGAVQSGGGQQWVSLSENLQLNFICSNYEDVIY